MVFSWNPIYEDDPASFPPDDPERLLFLSFQEGTQPAVGIYHDGAFMLPKSGITFSSLLMFVSAWGIAPEPFIPEGEMI